MPTLKESARRVGILYFVFALLGVLDEFFVSAGFIVAGDPAATAGNIMSDALRYRFSLLLGLVNLSLFVVLVVLLYDLFRDISRKLGMVMVLFVMAGVSLSFLSTVLKSAPLVFLNGDAHWSAFTEPQLEVLSFGFLKLRSSGSQLAMAFWGLWLFPFGMLVMRSGFIPKVFGIALLVAGAGYLVTSVTGLLLPEYRQAIFQWMTPLYLGELPIIFWLMIKGAREVPQTAVS